MGIIIFPVTSSASSNSNWQPVPEWPFAFQEFQNAVIYTVKGQIIKAKANIHVQKNVLWYENHGKRLAANPEIINKVIIADTIQYYKIKNKLCRVLREDTINGKISRLYICETLDQARYNEIKRAFNQSFDGFTEFGNAMTGMVNGVLDSQGSINFDQEPLPMDVKFYMFYEGDTFEANESNILKHLPKEEWRAYRTYVRSAEVRAANRSSMENVWITFFVSKGIK